MIRVLVSILVSFSLISCALWERHESLMKEYTFEGKEGFYYYLGYHLLKEQMEITGNSEEQVTKTLMEKALLEQGLCPNGYYIRKTLYTENADPLIFGVCKAGN